MISVEYDEIIRQACAVYGLEEWYVRAIIETESGGDPKAVSGRGAIGLMQIMPATGQELGLTEAELFDPQKNIMAGCEYLFKIRRWLRKKDFVMKLMAAAYNGGIGNVWKSVGIPPLHETEEYVKKVMSHKP